MEAMAIWGGRQKRRTVSHQWVSSCVSQHSTADTLILCLLLESWDLQFQLLLKQKQAQLEPLVASDRSVRSKARSPVRSKDEVYLKIV